MSAHQFVAVPIKNGLYSMMRKWQKVNAHHIVMLIYISFED
ncbi:unnamed protein product [Schistosoma curassoni]|uniref:Uncharacterized protein n=1 Tax=Schistosoma curassoni TaxID=6186 RepID=A0A183L4P8_9TREM|nr:unnamed protein product [Schistosoma curassoni]